MGLLESFLYAPGRSGTLPEASRTLLDDRGGLKHYACGGLEVWEGSNIMLVMFLVLPGQATGAKDAHSGWRRRTFRTINF